MTDTHSLTDAATAVVSTPAVGVMHAVATPQPPQPPRLRSPSSPPPSHPPPPPSRGVGVSTTRDIPALVIQLTRELRHDSLSGVAALVHLKVVQAATAEEFHRATVANEEGQKQSKAVVDQEIAEQHDSFKEQFDAVVCDLDSERAVIDLLTSEKESKEKQLTSQLEERDAEIAEGAARIVELEAALAFETTRREESESMIDDLATMLENFSLMTAEFNGDKGIVDGRIAVLKKLTIETTKSVELSTTGLHALSNKADGDSLDKQKHRPSPLDLQTIAKTSVHHPMATSQNAVLAELAEEVRVQRARAEQLEKERDDAEQGEQARSLHVAMETRVLHAKLKNAFERIAASRKTAATMRENLTAHQGALSACESSVEELSTELQDAKDEVTDLTEQLASCEDKVLSAATAASESSEAAEQTEQKLQQAEARAALLAERGTDLQTQLGDAQTRSSGSAESAAAAKAALDKAEDRHKAAAIRVRELEAESTTEQAWSDAIQTAREEMKQAEDHEASLIQSLSKEKTRRIVVETQVADIKKKHNLVASDLTVANRKIRALQAQCADLSAAAVSAKASATAIRRPTKPSSGSSSDIPAFPTSRSSSQLTRTNPLLIRHEPPKAKLSVSTKRRRPRASSILEVNEGTDAMAEDIFETDGRKVYDSSPHGSVAKSGTPFITPLTTTKRSTVRPMLPQKIDGSVVDHTAKKARLTFAASTSSSTFDTGYSDVAATALQNGAPTSILKKPRSRATVPATAPRGSLLCGSSTFDTGLAGLSTTAGGDPDISVSFIAGILDDAVAYDGSLSTDAAATTTSALQSVVQREPRSVSFSTGTDEAPLFLDQSFDRSPSVGPCLEVIDSTPMPTQANAPPPPQGPLQLAPPPPQTFAVPATVLTAAKTRKALTDAVFSPIVAAATTVAAKMDFMKFFRESEELEPILDLNL